MRETKASASQVVISLRGQQQWHLRSAPVRPCPPLENLPRIDYDATMPVQYWHGIC